MELELTRPDQGAASWRAGDLLPFFAAVRPHLPPMLRRGHAREIQAWLLAWARLQDAIKSASGRWKPDAVQPEPIYPGDAVAVRFLATPWAWMLGSNSPRPTFAQPKEVLLTEVAVASSMLCWLEPELATGLAHSHPPDAELLAAMKFPASLVTVIFGQELPISVEFLGVSEADVAFAREMERETGGVPLLAQPEDLRVSGVCLVQSPTGGLGDEALVLVSTGRRENDTNLTRLRGVLPIHVVAGTPVGDMLGSVAAAVSFGEWRTPPAELPDFPVDTREFRRALRANRMHKAVQNGGVGRVHVLDLSSIQPRGEGASNNNGTARHSQVTHLRRGHWRRVRVGPKTNWKYEGRWIAPVVVKGYAPLLKTAARVYRVRAQP